MSCRTHAMSVYAYCYVVVISCQCILYICLSFGMPRISLSMFLSCRYNISVDVLKCNDRQHTMLWGNVQQRVISFDKNKRNALVDAQDDMVELFILFI